jgi:hypothetical protein
MNGKRIMSVGAMNANVEYKKRSVLKQWTINTYRSKIEDNGKHKMQRSDPNGCILCNVVWRSELFSKTKR